MNLYHWSVIGPAIADGFKVRHNNHSSWLMYEKEIDNELHLIEISDDTNQLYKIVTSPDNQRLPSRHYLNGPSFECFSPEGKLVRRIYSEGNVLSRDPELGPAEELNQIGMLGPFESVNTKKYYWCGQLHRLDGPAIVKTSLCGVKIHEEYWTNGKRIDKFK